MSKTPAHRLAYGRRRRAELAAAGFCINSQSHGLATNGRLCAACRIRHTPPRPTVSLALPASVARRLAELSVTTLGQRIAIERAIRRFLEKQGWP